MEDCIEIPITAHCFFIINVILEREDGLVRLVAVKGNEADDLVDSFLEGTETDS